MPVATLILVRPGIEVKPVKGDALGADRDGENKRANFAIEAVLVHAEVGRGIAQPNKARGERYRRTEIARVFSARAGCRGLDAH